MISNDNLHSFVPYGRQTITETDIEAVTDVLRSPYLTQGPVVPLFEKGVAQKVRASYAVAVNSATSALHISCLALGLGPGDWLWTSPITFVASANCGLYCGASIDFVDIDPSTGLMDVEALSIKLEYAERQGKLPKVVIPVHLTGASCDMEAIAGLADRYGFFVVEDASHAIGGSYQDQPVGCCLYSDICVFSFHPVKIITTAEGGLALTNNPQIAEKMADLRSHGITKDSDRFQLPADGPWSYEQQCLGFNYRMTDLQAALGLSQLERLDKIVDERNRLYWRYYELFRDLPACLLSIPVNVRSSVHLAVMRLNADCVSLHRSLFEHLRESSIGVQVHYSPVHLQPYYRKLGFVSGSYPCSEAYAQSVISLPLFPGLLDADQDRVVSVVEKYLGSML